MKKRVLVIAACFLLLSNAFMLEVSANSPPGGYPPGTLSPYVVIFYIILAVPGLFLTILIERLTAKMLPGYNRYLSLITKTNIISQVLMHFVYLRTYTILYPYEVYGIIVLELMVYIGEFLTYKKKMKDIPTGKILLYTIVANTVSLLAGTAMIFLVRLYLGR